MLRGLLHSILVIAVLLCHCTGTSALAANSTQSTVSRTDNGPLARSLRVPIYEWNQRGSKPRAIVLAIHGLTMHGTMFDTWARNLAEHQLIVAAPDLRGYGEWYASGNVTAVNYKDSEQDLVELAVALRNRHRGIPLFVAGESLGGTLALRIAAQHPDLVDGLILSAPAIRHYHQIPLSTIADGVKVFGNPKHKVDLSPYIKNYFSEDPEIAREEMADPLIRKTLSLSEIASSCRIMCSSADYIADIPEDMPILILQGKKDRMVKLKSIDMLEKKLKTTRQTVCWFPQRGHILLETAHVRKETVDRINNWLNANCRMRTVEGAEVAGFSERERFIGMDDEREYIN